MHDYLIPANSKKSLMIFGMFNTIDFIIAGLGVGISLLLMLILPIEKLLFAIIALSPGLLAVALVLPIPNYHNVRTIIKLAWEYYTTRQKYIWKGWCYRDGEETKE